MNEGSSHKISASYIFPIAQTLADMRVLLISILKPSEKIMTQKISGFLIWPS
jgi:hypothetical protein